MRKRSKCLARVTSTILWLRQVGYGLTIKIYIKWCSSRNFSIIYERGSTSEFVPQDSPNPMEKFRSPPKMILSELIMDRFRRWFQKASLLWKGPYILTILRSIPKYMEKLSMPMNPAPPQQALRWIVQGLNPRANPPDRPMTSSDWKFHSGFSDWSTQ